MAVVFGGVIGAPSIALADKPAPKGGASTTPSRGAELFKKSVEAYRRGDFKEAIELLNEAYSIDPQPVLLYNLARAYDGAGDLDNAIATYERYLREEPNAPDKGAIEGKLTTLKKQRDEREAAKQKKEEPKPPPPPERPPPPPPRERSVLPYVVAGAGVVGIGAGAVLGIMATGKNDDASAEPVQQKSMDLKDSADGLATGSTVMFIVGGLLVAAGATWWVLDSPGSGATGSTRNVRIGLGPGYVGGTLP